MAPLCLLYFIAVGTCLSVAGLLAEHALPATAPRRGVWCAVITGSLSVPILFSCYRSSPAIEVWGHQLVRLSADPALGSASHGAFDRNWLDCSAPYGQIFMRLWLFSAAVLLLWALASAWRLAGLSRTGRRGHSRRMIVDGVPVIVTESVGPATVGLWRSRVLVPSWVLALPAVQRRYVLHHEEQHRKAHDARLLCVASILVSLFPWNVPLWWQLRRLRLAVEMDCDSRVVSTLGDAAGYGALLLAIARAASRGARLQPALLGGAGMLERRLNGMLAPPPRRMARRFLAPVLAIVLLLAVLSVPHPDPAPGHAARHSH